MSVHKDELVEDGEGQHPADLVARDGVPREDLEEACSDALDDLHVDALKLTTLRNLHRPALIDNIYNVL